jgi:formylmethanofuran dehydrogenase subunit A
MIHLKGGRVIDPVHNRDAVGDVYIEDGRIAEFKPGAVYKVVDVRGKIVMAGGIDIHSHIGGGNVNAARMLLPDAGGGQELPLPGQTFAGPCYPASETGRLYAQMGYTTVMEPAMPMPGALRTHLELADIPYIDRAAVVVLGNEDFLLRLLREKTDGSLVRDYIAWAVQQTKALGVKVVNAGGAMAFKENVRTFSLDDVVPSYGLSSREIFTTLQRAVHDLGIPHPLHLHVNNLGVPGNIDSIADTIAASQGLPLHLAHVQFYSYGITKRGGVASAAAQLAEIIMANKNITADVGQVMFGQTVTISSACAGNTATTPRRRTMTPTATVMAAASCTTTSTAATSAVRAIGLSCSC